MGSLMSRSGEEQYVLGGNEFSLDLVQIVLYYKTSSFVEYIAVYLFSWKVAEVKRFSGGPIHQGRKRFGVSGEHPQVGLQVDDHVLE